MFLGTELSFSWREDSLMFFLPCICIYAMFHERFTAFKKIEQLNRSWTCILPYVEDNNHASVSFIYPL